MKKQILFWLPLLIGLCCSCSGGCYAQNETETEELKTPLSVVNWNVQTFFDANKDGCEYTEFQKSSDWNKEKYQERVKRLAQVISTLDADIYVFEEIENENVLQDISNELSGKSQTWNQKKFWNDSVFVKEEDTAIGIGILSRYPITEAKTHSMDIRIHKEKQPVVRYILQTTLSIKSKKVSILVNHWKSKVGGQNQTEIWRDWQESILAKITSELQNKDDSQAIIICGDFNRDAADFILNDNNTILRYSDFGYTDYTTTKSMWFSDSGQFLHQTGSYYYDDRWERIDNILICGDIKIAGAEPSAVSPWASPKGIPESYKIYSGEGYSDHLPVIARLIL